MSKQLKLLPAFVMLVAGALTSIITFRVGYETKSALKILLLVLVVFYILGLILQKQIFKFETANEKLEKERLEKEKLEKEAEEGTVVEKDESEINKANETGEAIEGTRPPLDKE